jgi:membrane protein YdbS with pleckstrin-like domain
MHIRSLNNLDRTEWWLVSLVVALCAVPAYMLIWMFHVFFQVALVPLAYIVLTAGVLTLVVKACMLVVSTKRKLNQLEEKENGS